MRRAGSVVPLHAYIARFLCACGRAGLGYVWGAAPYNPARELSSLDLPPAAPCGVVSSSALRAYIARFFMRLRARGFGLRQGAPPPITPARELSSLDLPLLLNTMRPRQLVRAFLFAATDRAGLGYVRGSAPAPPTGT